MAKAEPIYILTGVLPVLAGYEKAWGLEHTYILDTVNNLGILYLD